MEKIEYNDEIYYYHNNKFLDSSFIAVNSALEKELANLIFSKYDYTTFNQDKILEFAKEIKEAGQYDLAQKVCLNGLSRFDDIDFIKRILPILTSCLRNLNKPKEAVEISLNYIRKYKCESIALLTSLAAAYCDIKDYENARKYANIAYARQGGAAGFKNELSLVYMRIKKESGEKDV